MGPELTDLEVSGNGIFDPLIIFAHGPIFDPRSSQVVHFEVKWFKSRSESNLNGSLMDF